MENLYNLCLAKIGTNVHIVMKDVNLYLRTVSAIAQNPKLKEYADPYMRDIIIVGIVHCTNIERFKNKIDFTMTEYALPGYLDEKKTVVKAEKLGVTIKEMHESMAQVQDFTVDELAIMFRVNSVYNELLDS